MNNTMTSDWKSKQSPRARGRIQIAMPAENSTDLNEEEGQAKQSTRTAVEISTLKEFNRTGTFPERMRSLGLNSGSDKYRKSVYANN